MPAAVTGRLLIQNHRLAFAESVYHNSPAERGSFPRLRFGLVKRLPARSASEGMSMTAGFHTGPEMDTGGAGAEHSQT
jgi:hypothetical protein